MPVRAALIGLVPSETYHFRMVTVNSHGTTYGLDQTFTTLPSTITDTPLVFQYETMVDTTQFGGAPGTPLVVTYAFDPAAPAGSGPFNGYPPESAGYGPVTMQIRLGKETISASGGGIAVWNDVKIYKGIDMSIFFHDGYEVSARNFSGKLLGKAISTFRFLLVKEDTQPAPMLGSSALPVSPDFAAGADTQYPDLIFAGETRVGYDRRGPFTLKVAPLATLAASAVSSKDGILNGSVNPQGGATVVYFEYGLTTGYGTATAVQDVGSGSSKLGVQETIGGLAANQTYHFRIVKMDSSGVTYGMDQAFTTEPPPPAATTLAASGVVTNAATAKGSVNPNGPATTAHFEYGLTAAYGSTTAEQKVGSGVAAVPAQAALTGLQPNKTYHYRVVANNGSGTVKGWDQTFTTPLPPPIATTLPASGVTFNAATAVGSVNPNGLATTVHFEYGPTTAYGASTANQGVGSGSIAVLVQAALGGLALNETYHFRVVASNRSGTTYGADRVFTTAVAAVTGDWAERTVVRSLPTVVGSAVEIGAFKFAGGTGSMEIALNVSDGAGQWSVAKRYIIPVRSNLTGISPANTWLTVLPAHDSGTFYGNNCDLEIKVSGAASIAVRVRTTAYSEGAPVATLAIKTTGLQSLVDLTATAAVTGPTAVLGSSVVTEVAGKAGVGAIPSGSAALDLSGGNTKGLRLRPRTAAGAPTSGAWNAGTMILDVKGNLYICTAAGTPGTWKKVGP